jgi:hypothetical protein
VLISHISSRLFFHSLAFSRLEGCATQYPTVLCLAMDIIFINQWIYCKEMRRACCKKQKSIHKKEKNAF